MASEARLTRAAIRGLDPRPEGLELTGPGTVVIRAASRPSYRCARLHFGIAGSEVAVRGDLWLDHRLAELAGSSDGPDDGRYSYTWKLADKNDPRIAAHTLAEQP